MKFNSINNSYVFANEIAVYQNGNETIFKKGDEKFELILNSLNSITKNSHDMPAFGVAIDEEIRLELKSGLWIELRFENTLNFNDMPFNDLLIEIKPNNEGFNLIRKVNGKYQGRCFYLNLENDMHQLYDCLINISKN